MAQVYPIFDSKSIPSSYGCLNHLAMFGIENPGFGYAAAIHEYLLDNHLDPGMYLIIEAENWPANGMLFTIDEDGEFKQGGQEATPIMTRWPPKTS